MELSLIALGPWALILIACLSLWALAHTQDEGRLGRGQPLWSIATATAVLVLLVSVVFALGSILLCCVCVAILIMAIHRYRELERYSLLWCLTVAAERAIPLEVAARAFALERAGVVGRRAHHLAEYLEAGTPLALALKRSGNTLPTEAMLAADMGEYTDNLGTALRQVTEQIDAFDSTLRSIVDKLIYLAALFFTAVAVVTFLMLNVVPVYARMFDDCALELPTVTLLFVFAAESIFPSVGVVLIVLMAVASVLCVLYYVGVSLRGVPLVPNLWWPADCASVMRWLAISVRRNRPINETVRLLASFFPGSLARRRLELAAVAMERGLNWRDSLRRSRLIRKAESTVFRAAEPAGNLAWALDEMAESSMRRASHRLNLFLSIAFPTVVVVAGLVFLFVGLGMLLPLMDLISSLA